MEDTRSLLMMVMQKVFQNRPKIVEETYQLIYNYNNGKREKIEYEKTLKTICDLINDELPSPILVYLLTMVDMPKEGGGQLPIMEKMQKTHGCLVESVRPRLLEFLVHRKTDAPIDAATSKNEMENSVDDKDDDYQNESKTPPSDEDCFVKPAKRPKRKIGKKKDNPAIAVDKRRMESLLDLCACYVVSNEQKLKKMYKSKLDKAWDVINENSFIGLRQDSCYNVIRDLNRKLKLIRMIESDNITTDILMEEYKDVDIILKEQHMYHIVNCDPFDLPQSLADDIRKFIKLG